MNNKRTKRRGTQRTGKLLSGLGRISFDRLEPRQMLAGDLPVSTANFMPFVVDSTTFISFMSCVSGNQTACQLFQLGSQPQTGPNNPEHPSQPVFCQTVPDSNSSVNDLQNAGSTGRCLDTITISSLSFDLLNNQNGSYSAGSVALPSGSGHLGSVTYRYSATLDYFEHDASTDRVIPPNSTSQPSPAAVESGPVPAPSSKSTFVSSNPANVLQPISMMASRGKDSNTNVAPFQIEVNRNAYFTSLRNGSITSTNKLSERGLVQTGLIDHFQALLIIDAPAEIPANARSSNVEHSLVSGTDETEVLIAKRLPAIENTMTEPVGEESRNNRTSDWFPAFEPDDELATSILLRVGQLQPLVPAVAAAPVSPFQFALLRHADESGSTQLVTELRKRQNVSHDGFVARTDDESAQHSSYSAMMPPVESTLFFAGILATSWFRGKKPATPDDRDKVSSI